MGIGLISLGLWLLFGIKIIVNDVNFFPPIVSYVFIIWGIVTVLKKYSNKKLFYSLILSFILMVLELFDSHMILVISCVLSVIHLYLLLYGIVEIINDYQQINFVKKFINIYLGIFVFINIYQIEDISLVVFLITVYAVGTGILVYHLYKINQFLYNKNEPVKIMAPIPRKRIYKVGSIVIMIVSIVVFVIGNSIIPLLNQSLLIKEYIAFYGQSENIKIEYLGIDYETYDLHLIGSSYGTGVISPQLYMKKELYKDVKAINFKLNISNIYYQEERNLIPIANNDSKRDIYKGYQNFCLQNKEKEDIYLFDELDIEENAIHILTDESTQIKVTMTLIDKNNKEKKEDILLKPIQFKEYGYQDKEIQISDMFVHGNTLMSTANIRINDSFFKQDVQYDTFEIVFINGDYKAVYGKYYEDYQKDFEYNSHELQQKIVNDAQFKIVMNFYNKNILVLSKTYVLKEIR